MTRHKDLQALAEGLPDATFTYLTLATKDGPMVRADVLEEDKPDLLESSRQLGRQLTKLLALGQDLFTVTKYEEGYPNEENQLVFAVPEEFPELKGLMPQLTKPEKLQNLAETDFHWRELSFEVRTIDVGDERAHLVRKVPSTSILAEGGRKKFFALNRKGILQLQENNGVGFDNGVDGFLWRGFLYMLRVPTIERLFGMITVLQQTAETVIEQIQKVVDIPGLEGLAEVAKGNQPLLRKLTRISQQDYLADLTIDALEAVATANNLGVVFTGEGADRRLDFENSNRREVLALLDDDFLQSELTNRRYAVRDQAKKPIQ